MACCRVINICMYKHTEAQQIGVLKKSTKIINKQEITSISTYDPFVLYRKHCWAFYPFPSKEEDYALHLIKDREVFVGSIKNFL